MFENQMKKVHFGGLLGERLQANLENWLLCAPSANPGMSDMFLRRDKTPRERLVPWYSEFPGKYITSAAAAYACNPDPRLKTEVDELINRLVDAQHKSEALLSPHPTKEGIAGKTEGWGDNGILKPLWELWGYYHLI
ncbi:MAG: hypothetical protein GX786_10600, partial [Clostridiales bacterium]|nr:hypothetical protein [Clostridiales bacterium]